jgi:hypothetical protein
VLAFPILTQTVGYATNFWKNKSSGRESSMMAAPTEARVLSDGQFKHCLKALAATYTPLVFARRTMDPNGPRLALSIISKSIICLGLLLNQFHLSCPRASAVGRRSEAFANPDKMDINEFKVKPSFQAGRGRPL